MKIDFDKARRIATQTIRDWCPGAESAQPDARGELIIKSPLRNDQTAGSFSINMNTGVFSDFADPDAKGDSINLYARINGLTDAEAAKKILGENSAPAYNLDAMRETLPVSPSTIQGFPVTKSWTYTDGKTKLLIARADTPEGKEIRPFHLENNRWIPGKGKKPKKGWPLYNLEKIIRSDKKSIIVVTEGEKAADAIPTPFISTTWSSGARSVLETDFSPLHGRRVILWPDNDDTGTEAMDKLQAEIIKKVHTLSKIEPAPYWPLKTDAADLRPDEISDALQAAKTIARPPSPFPLIAVDEMELRPPRWIIKGILEADCLACIFGSSGSGKSYTALSMAAHIATGRPFCGCDIKRGGPIIYIAGEGFNGLKRRLVAWELFHETQIPAKSLFISRAPAAFGDDESIEAVKESVSEIADEYGSPTLIIIDTWARSLFGDENSSADVGTAVRQIGELCRDYEASCLVIHHTGKGDQSQARGSSALRGAVDAEYKVENSAGILTLSNNKMKDGDPIEPLAFCFKSVDLGISDEDGESVFSSVVTPTNIEITNEIDNTNKTGKALEIIKDAGGKMKLRLFHEEMKAQGMSQKTVKRIKDRLQTEKRIQIKDGEIYAFFM